MIAALSPAAGDDLIETSDNETEDDEEDSDTT